MIRKTFIETERGLVIRVSVCFLIGVVHLVNGRREHMALEGCPLIHYFQAPMTTYPLPQPLQPPRG
jgi:hypothetical protein